MGIAGFVKVKYKSKIRIPKSEIEKLAGRLLQPLEALFGKIVFEPCI